MTCIILQYDYNNEEFYFFDPKLNINVISFTAPNQKIRLISSKHFPYS